MAQVIEVSSGSQAVRSNQAIMWGSTPQCGPFEPTEDEHIVQPLTPPGGKMSPMANAAMAGRDGHVRIAKSASGSGVRSSVIHIEEARDFTREKCHKYTALRPAAVSGQWSFERRQVTGMESPKGIRVHWASSKTESVAGGGPVQEAKAKASSVAQNGAGQEQDEARGGAPVAAKAVHSRINVLAPTTKAATTADDATTSESKHSGSSVVVLNPKESLGDVSIRVEACGSKSAEGKEEFKVRVAPSRSRSSIHLEGHILTAGSSKTDLVHDFKMAAVGNPHNVHDAGMSSEEDPDCPPHKELIPSNEDVTATTEQGATNTKEQTSAPQELPAPEGQKVHEAPPLQKNVEHENISGRETFRAAVVPEANDVPVLGSLTKVVSSVRSEQGGRLSSPPGFGDNRTCGPFEQELSAHEVGESAEIVVAPCRRGMRKAKVVQHVVSSERLDRIPRASARSGLMEEFLFSSTTVGLTEKDRQALPPVHEPGMSLSRVRLPPTNRLSEFGFSATTFGIVAKDRRAVASSQSLGKRRSANRLSHARLRPTNKLSEFGFSATTVGLTEKDRRAIASSQSLHRRPSVNRSSRVHLRPANRLSEFGFSATTVGLTDKDRRALASSQSLKKRPGINRSKSSHTDFHVSSKKSLRATDCRSPGDDVREEFGFGLVDRDAQNLTFSRERFQVSDRQSSRTLHGLAERIPGELLPVRHVSRSASHSSRSAGARSSATTEALMRQQLTENEFRGSSQCIFVDDLEKERNVNPISELGVSTEMLQGTARPVLSIIDEEESTTDVDANGVTLRKRVMKTLKVTPSTELLGSTEGSSTFENSNPATYNSSNQPGPPVGSFYEQRLLDEGNSVGAPFEPPRDRASAVRFLDNTVASQWAPDTAKNLPSIDFQRYKGNSATTFPSARSQMDIKTVYETAYNSSEAQSPSPMPAMEQLGTVSVSSSSSLEANGLRINQEAQLCLKPGTLVENEGALSITEPNGVLRDTGDAFGSDFGIKQCAGATVGANQVRINEEDRGFHPYQQYPLHLQGSMPARRAGSIEINTRPPYCGQFGQLGRQTGAQGWLPYGRYCEPPIYQDFGAEASGTFEAQSHAYLKPSLRAPYPRTPGVQAIVATATGGLTRMPPSIRRRSPEFAQAQVPYGRMRLSTAGTTRKGRRAEDAYLQRDVPYVGPRATISAQQNVRVGQAYGPRLSPRARRSVSPGHRLARAMQQRPHSPPGQRGPYWENTLAPGMVSSWHGGCYENPAFEPFEPMAPSFASAVPAPQSIDGWWTPGQEYRMKRKKAVFRVESVSTFESHENANEPRAPTVRSPEVCRKPPLQEKVTSTKTVQTEDRGGSARCVESAAADTGRPKIITPRVKTHVDIDDSNSETRNVSYTRVRTQTETVQQPWEKGGGQSPEFSRNMEPSFLSSGFGGPSPHPGYINQNFVCPPYVPNFRPEIAATTSMQVPTAAPYLGQQMAQMTPPAASQMAYYGQFPASTPQGATQPASPPAPRPAAPAQSSSDRAASCPLSSCFKGAFSRPEESSEEQPKERDSHCCRRERRRRHARSPLPPPSVGSTFTVGYMMNSDNELSPVLMPLNATPKQPSAIETAASKSIAPSAHAVSSLGSANEEDPVAELEKRVQEQIVEIEKAIQEQDARWKEKELSKRKETARKKPPKDKTGKKAKRGDAKLRKIFVAKAEDDSSAEECDTEPQSWFSWSRTSKSRKGVQLKVPRVARTTRSIDSQTEGSSASRASSKGKLSEGSDKIAIPGVSSSEAAPSAFTWATRHKKPTKRSSRGSPDHEAEPSGFTWATRRKKATQPSPRASPGSETSRAGFTWATRRKKSSQSSQRGSPSREAVRPDSSLEKHRKKSSPRGSPAKVAASRSFLSATRRKMSPEPSPRGSPDKEAIHPDFVWELHRNKPRGSSPRGSPIRKVYYADDDSSKSDNRSRGESPPRTSGKRAPSPDTNCSGRSSPVTDNRQQRRRSAERSTPDIALRSGAETDTDGDNALLAKIKVGFPGARRTQRRWSRTEMHRSTSYDTATSSMAPSSTTEKRARSAGHFPSEKSSRAAKKRSLETVSEVPPSSCWQSVCNFFGGAEPQPSSEKVEGRKKSCCSSVCDLCRSFCEEEPRPRKKSSPRRRSSAGFPSQPPVLPAPPVLPPPPVPPSPPAGYPPLPPKPKFRRRQRSTEDVTEKSEAVETKPSSGGSILSNIFNWFSSRSGDKQNEGEKGSKETGRGSQGSSFQRWMAEKERALKQNQYKLRSASQERPAKRSRERLPEQKAAPLPQELYFEEEGGPRWVIKYSPSFTASCGQPAVDGPSTTRPLKSTSSRERTPPVMTAQRPPGVAEMDWSVQYLYGPSGSKQGSPAQSGSRSPLRMPAPPSMVMGVQGTYGQQSTGQVQPMATTGFSVPPSRGFDNTPDWSIRITQGRERSSSSRGSIRSKGPGKQSPRGGSKEADADQQPSFILRIVEPRPRSRGGSAQSLERSGSPEKKKSEVTFKDKVETQAAVSPPAEQTAAKPEKTESSPPPPPPPPAVEKEKAPPAPPVAPRVLKTEESFKHEFYEEMDERGKAATMAPAVSRVGGGSTEVAAQSVAKQMAAIDVLLSQGAEQHKVPETAALVPKKPSPASAPTEEKKHSLPGNEKGTPAADHAGATAALPSSHSEPTHSKATKKTESPKPGGKKPSLSPGDPAHTNYVLEMKGQRERQPYWSDPLSYKCPTVQEVAGYAIITAVLLLGLVLLVSVPRMRSQALNAQE
ncbi:hypothetical protein HPB50_006885 [Hyalomma asiaticum]|uniref:Uncharacterized protein n=1 Tax=Hyalomma asiaticum TaxID=266040 RepID=A0ACB7RXB9_HYAAI|nr:hypothetical protein HPB50_006885 [Hyalomma asiaticum]